MFMMVPPPVRAIVAAATATTTLLLLLFLLSSLPWRPPSELEGLAGARNPRHCSNMHTEPPLESELVTCGAWQLCAGVSLAASV